MEVAINVGELANKKIKISIDPIQKLADELGMEVHDAEVFLLTLPDAQRNQILPDNLSSNERETVSKDVFNALQLTDEQIEAFLTEHLKLDVSIEQLIAFSVLINFSVSEARRLWVDLHRFGIKVDMTDQTVVDVEQPTIKYSIDMSNPGEQQPYHLAMSDRDRVKGFKPYDVLIRKYKTDEHNKADYAKNILWYLHTKYKTHACSKSREDIVKAAATRSGLDRLLRSTFIDVTDINEIESKKKDLIESLLKRKEFENRNDQMGVYTNDDATLYANTYWRVYQEVFWKLVVLINQELKDPTQDDIKAYSRALRTSDVVPSALVLAYKSDGERFVNVNKAREYVKINYRPVPKQQISVDWLVLFQKEISRLDVVDCTALLMLNPKQNNTTFTSSKRITRLAKHNAGTCIVRGGMRDESGFALNLFDESGVQKALDKKLHDLTERTDYTADEIADYAKIFMQEYTAQYYSLAHSIQFGRVGKTNADIIKITNFFKDPANEMRSNEILTNMREILNERHKNNRGYVYSNTHLTRQSRESNAVGTLTLFTRTPAADNASRSDQGLREKAALARD